MGDGVGNVPRDIVRCMSLSAAEAPPGANSRSDLEVRFAQHDDVPALLRLEARQWATDQAATAEDLHRRIETFPLLSVVAVRPDRGEIVASAFLRPITRADVHVAATWAGCAHPSTWPRPEGPQHQAADCLFGMSLTSVDAGAVDAMTTLLRPHVGGFRSVYLGSPLPGLRAWRERNPALPVEAYVYDRSKGLPRDPQLRYYHGRGLRRLEAVKPGYFPHPQSLDYGAVISGDVRIVFGIPGPFVPSPDGAPR